jgi:hypothetical protein
MFAPASEDDDPARMSRFGVADPEPRVFAGGLVSASDGGDELLAV